MKKLCLMHVKLFARLDLYLLEEIMTMITKENAYNIDEKNITKLDRDLKFR